MYTPFGGSAALDTAIGENMVRVRKGKQAHALIAPSHEHANQLETLRQVTLTQWKGKLDNADRTMRQHHNSVVAAGYTHKMRMRHIMHDPHLNPQQRKEALDNQRGDHALSIPHEYDMAKADKALYTPKYESLKQTEIANATVHVDIEPAHPQWPKLFPTRIVKKEKLYPSLHPDPKPLENIGHKDKLYVLGHGAPVSDALPTPGLYAKPTLHGPSLSPGALAQHLSDKGLPSNFEDLRLTSCQSVPLMDEITPHSVTAARSSGFLAPELSKAVKQSFPKLSVTGYMGNGLTFPFDSSTHLRALPGDAKKTAPRKQMSVKFPPL
ncbi:hypothetical protein DWU98_04895 [Dyella monticola]|uniref:Uncharacterized protein n=2 Tax=Dyella monticola TaxID=1927958 RepID=A0A370X5W7_9GAMM|nr:hypothetical protein DWU98_04895 [Dyella monticola]